MANNRKYVHNVEGQRIEYSTWSQYNEKTKQLKDEGYSYDTHTRSWILSEEFTEVIIPVGTILGLGSHKYRELMNQEFYVKGTFTTAEVKDLLKRKFTGEEGYMVEGSEYVNVNIRYVSLTRVGMKGDERIEQSLLSGFKNSFGEIKTWRAKYPDWRERKELNDKRKQSKLV